MQSIERRAPPGLAQAVLQARDALTDDRRGVAPPGELWIHALDCLLPCRDDDTFWQSVADAAGEPVLVFDRRCDLFGCVKGVCTHAVRLSMLDRWQSVRDEGSERYKNALARIEPREARGDA